MGLYLAELPIEQIVPGETWQEPTADLVESMARRGLLRALEVREEAEGTYRLLEGSDRWLAARQLRWRTVTCIVEPASEAALPYHLKALLLRTRRTDLAQIHTARHVKCLLQEQEELTQTQLAREIGIGKSSLCQMLQVAHCADLVAAVEDEGLEFGAAKPLATLAPVERQALLEQLRASQNRAGKFPPVRQVEELVRQRKGKAPPPALLPEAVGALVDELQLRELPVEAELIRGKQTRLKVTGMVAEADEAWVHAFLTESREAAARTPGARPGRGAQPTTAGSRGIVRISVRRRRQPWLDPWGRREPVLT
jgi:ParB/RepB/Spo0J family partition protein